MKVHLIEYDAKHVYCKARSFHLVSTNDLKEVTCKTCEALYKVETGQIDEIPFGGSYDSKGKMRKNIGGNYQGRKYDDFKGYKQRRTTKAHIGTKGIHAG
jgi:hypothetical protein